MTEKQTATGEQLLPGDQKCLGPAQLPPGKAITQCLHLQEVPHVPFLSKLYVGMLGLKPSFHLSAFNMHSP